MCRQCPLLFAMLLSLSAISWTVTTSAWQPTEVPPLNHGTFLWQGFDHRWIVNGHRIGNHGSFIHDDAITVTPDGVQARATATMKLSVGADGDYARPRVLYSFVYAHHVGITRGQVEFEFRSDRIPHRWPPQSPHHVLTRKLRHSLNRPAMNYGNFDHYAAVLRGFDVSVRCPDEGVTCETSSWLRDFGITLDNCETTATEYTCDTSFYLHRYQSPDILRKLPDAVLYRVQVYYTLLGGNHEHFAVTEPQTITTHTRLKARPPAIQQEQITGACLASDPGCTTPGGTRYAAATMGITGFRYQLRALPGGSLYLGRYMKRLTFQLANGPYDPATGTMQYRVTFGYKPAVPISYDSRIEYQLNARLLQFGQADILEDRDASGVICDHTFLTMGLHKCRGYFGPDYAYPKFQDTVTLTN